MHVWTSIDETKDQYVTTPWLLGAVLEIHFQMLFQK